MILSAAEMKLQEQRADAAGISYRQLMENAGSGSALFIHALLQQQAQPGKVLLLCGKGNNAGDAFVAGRRLAASGVPVEYHLLCGTSFTPLAQLNFSLLPPSVRPWVQNPGFEDVAVIVDAVFGTGFSGTLPPQVQTIFRQANHAAALRVALDLPSGLGCDSGIPSPHCFRAHHTLAYGALKPALVLPQCQEVYGQVHCLPIGLLFEQGTAFFQPPLPPLE